MSTLRFKNKADKTQCKDHDNNGNGSLMHDSTTGSGSQQINQLLRVGETHLGKGVFAVSQFAADQIIAQITGEVIEDAEYGSDYCMELSDRHSLEPDSPFRYLNHSCDPNCELFQWEGDESDDEGMPDPLFLQALRDIAPGEELLIDYAWPADGAIPCGCQSIRCRGWIVDVTEAHLVTRIAKSRRNGKNGKAGPLKNGKSRAR